MKNESLGVAQYFYHCIGEELPIRDIPNTNGKGPKTEPHYENFSENWCTPCMNSRIKSANRNKLDYLFLVTKYRNKRSKMNDKLIVVGYLKRAQKERWLKLSKKIPSGVKGYMPNPTECEFFAGDKTSSRFVSANNGYELKTIKNGRYIWYIDKILGDKIIHKLDSGQNIINSLLIKTQELKKESGKSTIKNKRC